MTTINQTISPPPHDPRERYLWVKHQLEWRGLSFAELGRREECSGSGVAAALRAPNQYLEKAIAEAIGMTPQSLFPERYDAQGNRLHRSRKPHRTGGAGKHNKDHATAV